VSAENFAMPTRRSPKRGAPTRKKRTAARRRAEARPADEVLVRVRSKGEVAEVKVAGFTRVRGATLADVV
jgi:hypothetical protein